MKISSAKHYIDKTDIEAVVSVLHSNYLSQGPMTDKFEILFAKYVGSKYAVAVSNGTSGLHLAVKALGLKQGDEVITTPFSFIVSTNCLLYENVTPIFVDIDEKTLNINPKLIEKAITKHTKAILPVDIFGTPTDSKIINRIAKKYGLKVISDSCESLGSEYKNKKTGSLYYLNVFGFFANKQITTGEGGMITTNSKKIAEIIRSLRTQGRSSNGNWLLHVRLGYNYRMTEMEAALGVTQLEKLGKMITKKNYIYDLYKKSLSDIAEIQFITEPEDCKISRFTVPIRVKNNKRSKIISALNKHQIGYKTYFPPIYKYSHIKSLVRQDEDNFPVCENASREVLCLPLYVGLTASQIQKVCKIIKESI